MKIPTRAKAANPIRRGIAMLAVSMLAVTGVAAVQLATAQPAQAATIPIDAGNDLAARFRTHIGYAEAFPGTTPGGNPLTNAVRFGTAADGVLSGPIPNPGNPIDMTQYVSPGTTSWVTHGRRTVTPLTADLSQQSALGFSPRDLGTEVETDVRVNIGQFIHVNNVIQSTSARYWRGNLDLTVFGVPSTFGYEMEETPNTGPCDTGTCDDIVTFLNRATSGVFIHDGLTYTVVIDGFTPPQAGTTCSPTLDADAAISDQFITVEQAITYGCLYATITRSALLRVVKDVDSPYAATAPDASFDFTSESTVPGSPADDGAWQLGDGGSVELAVLRAEALTITEADLTAPWELGGVSCVDGTGAPIDGIVYDGATLTIPAGTEANEIVCTYTNTFVPRATLTLEKTVEPGDDPTPATPAAWTLSADGIGAVDGESVTGLGGSDEIVSQSVIVGEYQLSEAGVDATVTAGYAQDGSWTCVDEAGAPVAVSDTETVTIAEGQNVSCSVTNRYSTGTLGITKTVTTTPAGGYDEGDTREFTAQYECLPAGPSGTVSVRPSNTNGVAGEPALIAGVPSGSTCTVTETDPLTGESTGLVDSSWVWLSPGNPAPVTIADGVTSTADIGNPAAQSAGELELIKAITPRPGTPESGYVGGDDRAFTVEYECRIDDSVVAGGVVDVTAGVATTVSVPATSTCAVIGEDAAGEPGDFADDTFAWDGYEVTDAVVIDEESSSAITITNYFVQVPVEPVLGELTVTKLTTGAAPASAVFTITVNCTFDGDPSGSGEVQLAADASATLRDIPVGATCTIIERDALGAVTTTINGTTVTDSDAGVAIVTEAEETAVTVVNAFATATATPTPDPSGSQTPDPTDTPDPTETPDPTGSPTPDPTGTPSETPDPTATPSATPTETPDPTSSPTVTPSATPSATETPDPTATPSATPSPSVTPSASENPMPSATPSATATAGPGVPGLPDTGVAPAGGLALAVLLLGLGAVVIGISRRRTQRTGA